MNKLLHSLDALFSDLIVETAMLRPLLDLCQKATAHTEGKTSCNIDPKDRTACLLTSQLFDPKKQAIMFSTTNMPSASVKEHASPFSQLRWLECVPLFHFA